MTPGRQALWIRTPKTGGTSIEAALLDLLLHCGDIPHFEECPPEGFVFPADKIICLAPNTADEVPLFARRHSEIWANALKFAVVRNPYDRFISGWKYLHEFRDKRLLDVLLDLPQSGHDYVHLTMLQADLLTLDGTVPGIHLLRFERLQQDMDALCTMMGMEPRSLPTLNQTPAKDKPYMEFYDDNTRRLIAEKYRRDFEIFGYEM